MNNRKYQTNPSDLLAQGQAIMSSSDESKYLFRVFAVNMVLSGTPASKVGASAGVTKAAVTSWVKIADEQGFEALKTKKQPGRPCKLSEEQKKIIDFALQASPKDSGYKTWDGNSLSDYIKKIFNVELSVRQCQRLFHEPGYSLIRPQSYPSKGFEDTEERQLFKKKREEIESDDNLILVYQDEVHFQIQTTITSAWFKKGSKPQVKSFPGRSKISYSGFVIPESGELFVAKPEKFNYSTTIEAIRDFLSAHPVPKGKKYALVMDNAPWHKKTKRLICDEALPEYADILKDVVFIKLPPYSPDLNPIEQVWRITRRENTHNIFFASISILELTIDQAFNSWAAPNDQLRTLCCFK